MSRPWTDEKLEAIIAMVLRAGVLIAAGIVAIGGCFYLIQHKADPVPYGTFVGASPNLRTLRGILCSAVGLQTAGVIQLGLVLLIATPIVRVAAAVIGFAFERDRLYVAVSSVVLAILIFSLVHST